MPRAQTVWWEHALHTFTGVAAESQSYFPKLHSSIPGWVAPVGAEGEAINVLNVEGKKVLIIDSGIGILGRALKG